MSECGLLDALRRLESNYDAATQLIQLPRFVTPGYVAAAVAFARNQGLSAGCIRGHDPQQDQYLSAIGLGKALGGEDEYPYDRKNLGRNYSTLEHLANPEAVDGATSAINGRLRDYLGAELPPRFVYALCEVVGDLHENVWSHGLNSGFSLAQKWKTAPPWYPLSKDYSLEFALADCGIGFLAETRNAGLLIETDQEAIEWCIQEGHSTKKIRPVSEWAQRMPPDVIGNPLRGIESTKFDENHHMGLGLFKLVRLVREFRGNLWLATGSSVLVLAAGHEPAYISLDNPWQGVAIACRFRSSDLAKVREDIESGDKDVDKIMEILGGRHG